MSENVPANGPQLHGGASTALAAAVLPPDGFEWTQDTCDVWQIAHLINEFAGSGWEPVFVVEGWHGVKVNERVGDETSRPVNPLRPYVVVFRRPIPDEEVGS
jgi:hypothetical protein